MSDIGIGKLITGPSEKDAIHIAVLPCIAAEELRPGQEVGFVYGSTEQVKSMDSHYGLQPIGIVDPFLKFPSGKWHVEKGDHFWVFMFPNTITGLRHDWAHPALTLKLPQNKSEAWLRSFADKWNFDYDQMLLQAQEFNAKGNKYERYGCVTAQGIDLYGSKDLDSGDEELFWQHIGTLTGKEFDDQHRQGFGWSCTC